jgi:prolyl oligopeptidase
MGNPIHPMRQLFLMLLTTTAVSAQSLDYPLTEKGSHADNYHGTTIADPYRWLEDDNAETTKSWVQKQNQLTHRYLQQIPSRPVIRQRLEHLWNYERFGMPVKRGGRYFFTRNTGLQNHSVLYVTEDLSAETEPRVLLDPNQLSPDNSVSLSSWTPNENATLLAYSVSKAGSDWQEFRIRDIDTGTDLPDTLKWIKFSRPSWAKDGRGFYYSRFPEPAPGTALTQQKKNTRLHFHQLGHPQEKDALIYERPDEPDWGLHPHVTDDGRYLIIHISLGSHPNNRLYYQDLTQPNAPVTPLIDEFEADYSFIDNLGSVFYFHTNKDAPRYRVIAIDITEPDPSHWREVIPQTEDKLESVSLIGGQFICDYLHHAHSLIQSRDLDGRLKHEIPLPGIGSVYGFGGRRDDTETFFSFTSFTTPAVMYRHDLITNTSTIFRKSGIQFDGSPFTTEQAFVPSKDGTLIPIFITRRKDLPLDGSHPTILYGYGGFNISLTPGFSVSRALWLEMGGIHVTANLRGGGEYGADWHRAGTKLEKQNVFDDFIAAAQWLIDSGYTQPSKLAIQGGSNGGLLVGACMTQRPELFGAALPSVGVMDMLRYHQFTIGWAWADDYGTSDKADEFKALLAYSPLHNLKPGTRYPATLVTTADHDDRVVPAHSFKFAATLQECQAKDGPPVLIRIETSAGHGSGTALHKVIEETTDQLSFLTQALAMKPLPW